MTDRHEDQDLYWKTHEQIHRTAHLLRRLLGWEVFLSWEGYQQKYGTQEFGLVRGQSFTTPTHVAFCEQGTRYPYRWEFRVFSPDHEDLNSFNPTTSRDDAWMLVQGLAEQEDPNVDGVPLESVFFKGLCLEAGENGNTVFHLKDFAALTAEQIFNAVSVAVKHLEKPERSAKEVAQKEYESAYEQIKGRYHQMMRDADVLPTPAERLAAYRAAAEQRDRDENEASLKYHQTLDVIESEGGPEENRHNAILLAQHRAKQNLSKSGKIKQKQEEGHVTPTE